MCAGGSTCIDTANVVMNLKGRTQRMVRRWFTHQMIWWSFGTLYCMLQYCLESLYGIQTVERSRKWESQCFDLYTAVCHDGHDRVPLFMLIRACIQYTRACVYTAVYHDGTRPCTDCNRPVRMNGRNVRLVYCCSLLLIAWSVILSWRQYIKDCKGAGPKCSFFPLLLLCKQKEQKHCPFALGIRSEVLNICG